MKRKKFIKHMMALRVQRNNAVKAAEICRKHNIPYEIYFDKFVTARLTLAILQIADAGKKCAEAITGLANAIGEGCKNESLHSRQDNG